MQKYFKALDKYISLKITFAVANIDLENDLKYRREFHELANAKADMETQLLILLNKKQNKP